MKKGLLLVLLAFLTGCNKDPVEIRHQPDLPTPDQWSVVNVDNSTIRSEWWEAFEDARLDELVFQALESNYDLKAASARMMAAFLRAWRVIPHGLRRRLRGLRARSDMP